MKNIKLLLYTLLLFAFVGCAPCGSGKSEAKQTEVWKFQVGDVAKLKLDGTRVIVVRQYSHSNTVGRSSYYIKMKTDDGYESFRVKGGELVLIEPETPHTGGYTPTETFTETQTTDQKDEEFSLDPDEEF